MLEPAILPTPASQADTLDGFIDLANEYRQKKRLGAKFNKDVRSFFLKSLARSYWESVRRYMTSANWPVAKACKAAGLNPSTQTRWDEMVPNFETICLLFARCDLDMNAVRFPSGHEAFRSAFFKTLEHIRIRYIDNKPAFIDEEAFECLRCVFRSAAILDALQAIDKSRAGDMKEVVGRLNQASESIATELETRFPEGRIKDGAAVKSIIADWLIPWVLFYAVIPSAQKRA